MADGSEGKAANRKRTLTKQDSGIFSTDTTPLTPYRPDFSVAAFREVAITQEMQSPRVSSKPPLARHRSLTEVVQTDDASLEEDTVLSAFDCRQARGVQGWGEGCGHTHCKSILTQWEHLKKCALMNSANICVRCRDFQKLILDHARVCTDIDCSVTLCSDAKSQLEQYRLSSASYSGRNLRRSNSFTMTGSGSTRMGLTPRGTNNPARHSPGLPVSNTSVRNSLTSAGIGMVPLDLAANPSGIKTRAEEIVSQLERASQEQPPYQTSDSVVPRPATLQSKPAPPASIPKISSIGSQEGPFPSGVVVHGVLSPIAEQPGSEYTPTPSPLSATPKDELSEKQFGVVDEPGGVDELAYGSMAPESPVQYPRQEILHHFCKDHLTPGDDGHYLEHRNYLLNDIQPLGEGGFGTCVPGQDLRTQKMFALKRNNRSDADKIDSIRSECAVLARLHFHEHVVQFWGAVLDEDGDQPVPRVVKMIMELAENGSLYDMLLDEDKNPAPLPVDQSLYYLHQVLQGVRFLHMSGVLHLDIKANNVLVFNTGRTVKLADFGSAMHMDDVSSIGVGTLKGCSPHFAAPEVICQHQPTFSADIWSTLCVLIQMLTAKLPGCYKMERSHHSMMFLIGKYTDDDLQQLVPTQELQLDSDVVELFRLVLQRNPHERPTALQLLEQVPCIVNACEYEKYFDFEYEEEEYSACEDEDSFQTAPTSLPLGPPAPVEHELVNPEKRDPRASVDSGVGESLRSDRMSIKRSSTGGSSGDSGFTTPMETGSLWQFSYRGQKQESIQEEDYCSLPGKPGRSGSFDSCTDTGYVNLIPYRARSSSYSHATSSHSGALASLPPVNPWGRSYEYDGECHSLPVRSNSPRITDQLRCLSLDSKPDPRLDPSQKPPLYSSSSAPTMSDLRFHRRLSLGLLARSESWQGERSRVSMQTNLRRTSSEVYVDRGPDIDTPEEKKQALFQLQLQQPAPTSSVSSTSEDHSLPSHTSSCSSHASSCSSYVSASSSIDTASSVSLDGVITSSQEGLVASSQDGGLERAGEVKRLDYGDANTKKTFRHII